MTLTEYFGGTVPDTVSYEDMDNASKGISRRTIPWSEVPNNGNLGPMQQLQQQRHVGAQVTKPQENETTIEALEV